MKFLRFKPIYMERVWGGRGFEEKLGRMLPAEKVIGESWEICDRPEAPSVVDGGRFDGKTLRQAIESDAAYVMGPQWSPAAHFPILVKWLDCRERLSLQVHPPKGVAEKLGGEPKTENWYVADCTEGAGLIAGLKKGVTKEEFVKSLADDSAEKLLHCFTVKKGDSLFVPSGRLHAIDGGNLILEIQQNSDTTYRVYDWGRVGLDGKPRQLHVEESIASIDFKDFEPMPIHVSGKNGLLCESGEFSINLIRLGAGETFAIEGSKAMHIVSVVEGGLKDDEGDSVSLSENIVVPYAESIKFTAVKPSVILVTK